MFPHRNQARRCAILEWTAESLNGRGDSDGNWLAADKREPDSRGYDSLLISISWFGTSVETSLPGSRINVRHHREGHAELQERMALPTCPHTQLPPFTTYLLSPADESRWSRAFPTLSSQQIDPQLLEQYLADRRLIINNVNE